MSESELQIRIIGLESSNTRLRQEINDLKYRLNELENLVRRNRIDELKREVDKLKAEQIQSNIVVEVMDSLQGFKEL